MSSERTGIEIVLRHGTDDERAAADALRAVLARWDLSRFLFTDLVTIDSTESICFSHPLTLSSRIAGVGPRRVLSPTA